MSAYSKAFKTFTAFVKELSSISPTFSSLLGGGTLTERGVIERLAGMAHNERGASFTIDCGAVTYVHDKIYIAWNKYCVKGYLVIVDSVASPIFEDQQKRHGWEDQKKLADRINKLCKEKERRGAPTIEEIYPTATALT